MLKQLFGLRTSNARTLATAVVFVVLCVCCLSQTVQAQATAFAYQGKLSDSGTPPTGQYDFTFKLFADPSGVSQIGLDVVAGNVSVTSGVFKVSLDFGSNFPGADRYLKIAVRQHSTDPNTPAYTPLAPLQKITSTPYSIQSLNAATATNATQLGGVAANQYVTTTNGGTNFIQNTTSPQASSAFNISGNGTANIFSATTQFNIGGNRVLSVPGTGNIFAGVGAGSGNTNTGIGAGGLNSFFGMNAGSSNTSGSFNTIVGAQANVAAGFLTNATAIGAGAVVSHSDSLVLGNNVNVGIGTSSPSAKLSVVAPGSAEIAGLAQSSTFRTTAGTLGNTEGDELSLASIGFLSGSNTSLGIRGRRITAGADWTTSAIGLGMDVDNTVRAADATLWLNANGNVGIGQSNPTAKLTVEGTVQSNSGGFKFPDGSVQTTAAANTTWTTTDLLPELLPHDFLPNIYIQKLNLPLAPAWYLVEATVEFADFDPLPLPSNVECNFSGDSLLFLTTFHGDGQRQTQSFHSVVNVSSGSVGFRCHAPDLPGQVVAISVQNIRLTAMKIAGNVFVQ